MRELYIARASALAMKNHRVEVGDTPSSVRDLWAGTVHS